MSLKTLFALFSFLLVVMIILALANYATFSPDTPQILSVTRSYEAKQYHDGDVGITAQRSQCAKGRTNCDQKFPTLTILVRNHSANELAVRLQSNRPNGNHGALFCRNQQFAVIPPQAVSTITCLDQDVSWHPNQLKYSGDYPRAVSICAEILQHAGSTWETTRAFACSDIGETYN